VIRIKNIPAANTDRAIVMNRCRRVRSGGRREEKKSGMNSNG